MKRMLRLYRQNPMVALVVNGLVFFVWAISLVLLITIMAVAFTA